VLCSVLAIVFSVPPYSLWHQLSIQTEVKTTILQYILLPPKTVACQKAQLSVRSLLFKEAFSSIHDLLAWHAEYINKGLPCTITNTHWGEPERDPHKRYS
jgi:hypothetical protein